MSKKTYIYALFDTDTEPFYLINISELPIISGGEVMLNELVKIINLQFYDSGNLAETLTTKNDICIFYQEDDSVLVWEGYVIKESIFTKNKIVNLQAISKLAEFKDIKIEGNYVDVNTHFELVELLKRTMDDNSINYDFSYTRPTTSDLTPMKMGYSIGGTNIETSNEITDVITVIDYNSKQRTLIVTQHEVFLLFRDYTNSPYFYNIKSVFKSNEKLGRVVREKTRTDSVYWERIYIEVLEEDTSKGTVSCRYSPYTTGLYHLEFINGTYMEFKKANFIYFSISDSTDFINHRNISNEESMDSSYIMPNTTCFWVSGLNINFYSQLHRKKLSAITEDRMYIRRSLLMDFPDNNTKVLAYVAKWYMGGQEGIFFPVEIENKFLVFGLEPGIPIIHWYEFDGNTIGIGISAPTSDNVRMIYSSAYILSDVYTLTNIGLYKITKSGSTWTMTLIQSGISTLTAEGYSYDTDKIVFKALGSLTTETYTIDNYIKDVQLIPKYYLGKLGEGNPEGLLIYSYKNNIFIAKTMSSMPTTSYLHLLLKPNSNLFNIVKQIIYPLMFIVRYDLATSKFQFLSVNAETTIHTLEDKYVDIANLVKYEYQTNYIDDIYMENPIRNITRTGVGNQVKIIRDIMGDWESYIDAIYNYYGTKKIMYEVTVKALRFWQYWDRVSWRNSTWRLLDIKQNYTNKETIMKLRKL